MKAKLKTTFERYGKYVMGHIEDVEMYNDVKSGKKKWERSAYCRITHIRIPKEVFERLLELDRRTDKEQRETDGKNLLTYDLPVIPPLKLSNPKPSSEVENIFDELMKQVRAIADNYEKWANAMINDDYVRISYRGAQKGAMLALLKIAELKKKYTEEKE